METNDLEQTLQVLPCSQTQELAKLVEGLPVEPENSIPHEILVLPFWEYAEAFQLKNHQALQNFLQLF
jgi:hypothetical protein